MKFIQNAEPIAQSIEGISNQIAYLASLPLDSETRYRLEQVVSDLESAKNVLLSAREQQMRAWDLQEIRGS